MSWHTCVSDRIQSGLNVVVAVVVIAVVAVVIILLVEDFGLEVLAKIPAPKLTNLISKNIKIFWHLPKPPNDKF